jgi:hypothetical protein
MKRLSTVAIIFAAALLLFAIPGVALAQTIKYEVRVKGYSDSGWVEVRAGRNIGGAVRRDKKGAWTDRVARGEELRVTITDRRARQCEVSEAIVGVVADNGFVRGAIVDLPFQREFKVSEDTAFDNVIVVVINKGTGRSVTRRVPIGTR